MDTYSQDCWTEAQWTQVQEAVRNEAKKQRVAASFLPLYGPLPDDAQNVPVQDLVVMNPNGVAVPPDPAGKYSFLKVNDYNTRRLTTLSVAVALGSAQVAQADLSSALVAFRRAANLIARAEDYLVFNGQAGPDAGPTQLPPCRTTGGDYFEGLLTVAQLQGIRDLTVKVSPSVTGDELVNKVEQAAGILERDGHLAPFALVLSTPLFTVAHTPNQASLVLPADRIKPLIDGPLLRSSALNLNPATPQTLGVMVSLGDDLVDLVVASEIHVRFIQVTAEESPRHVYRVSERFTLRIKQPRAIVLLG